MGRKILSLAAIVAGEAILIAIFLLWGKYEQNVLILNIIVASIAYLLISCNLFFPGIDCKERTQKRIGSIGIWWTTMSLYAAAVFAVILLFSNLWTFATLVIVHAVLLLGLILGLIASMKVSGVVSEVYVEQQQQRASVDDMRKAMRKLKTKVDCCMDPISPEHKGRINDLAENLRYISPSNVDEAFEMEQAFVDVINSLATRFEDYELNKERVERELREAESIYRNRKNIYNN